MLKVNDIRWLLRVNNIRWLLRVNGLIVLKGSIILSSSSIESEQA
ncbi:13670_t:CDS:2 [Gigaspora margarita]|uniref:13670_t:CDS:1 n=1 Tax=Gigaspora margarita TaxID=4874 RepID=A0ABN7V0J0_GIGMA|nr:13670_t:CDS:2 [Gigaspora margarita]